MKNSKLLFKRGLLSCMVAALAMGFAVAQEENQEETVWTEVTEYFIVNPDYSNGTTGWTEGTVMPAVNYHNAELFEKNATVLQTITGLQPGTYKVTVQAFHREKGNDGGNNYTNNAETIQAFLVVGTNEVAIKSLYSEVKDNTVTKHSNGWPNTQQGAMEYFNVKHPGSYMNELEFTIEEGTESITIGISCKSNSSGRWTCWDNFKLYKEGEFDPLALLKVQISNLASLSGEMTTLGASAAAADVNAYITTYNGYTAETPAETISAAVAEATNLAASISEGVMPAIESLSAAVATAESVNGKYAEDNAVPVSLKENLTAAITDAKNVLANTSLTNIVAAAGTEVTEVTAASKALTNFVDLTLPLNKAKALAERIDKFNANGALAETDAYGAVEASLVNAALSYDEMATNVAALNTVIRENMTAAFLSTATEESPIDMTSFIVNPYIYQKGERTAEPDGWTTTTIADKPERTGDAGCDTYLYCYSWSGTDTHNISSGTDYHQQVVVPNGYYTLKAATVSSGGSGNLKLYMKQADDTFIQSNFNGNWDNWNAAQDQIGTTTVTPLALIEGGSVVLGIRGEGRVGGTGQYWHADNFTLLYTGPNKNRLIDGVGFHAAEEYTATTMSYDRKFAKDTWLTVCLPFAYTLPEGVIAEELTSVENGVFTFAAVEAMEANKPYIIKNTTETAALFAALENVTVAATPATMETTVEGATMVGVYESVKAADLVENNDVLFFNTKGELKYLDAANTAAVEAITFTPFRAYILVDKNTFDDSTAKTISVRHDDGTTGIEKSKFKIEKSEFIYDLLGRRVQKMEKGIYIVNGKKVSL